MKLFLKHLFRSIVKKPLQPLVLIITITLAVSICIFSLSMDTLLEEEYAVSQVSRFGTAEISITTNSTSKTRFVFEDDAERLLGERGVAVGSFELPMFFGEEKKVAMGVAVDFLDVSEIFEIEFLEYGVVTPSTVADSAFVSSDFAVENGISLGDSITFEIAGGNRTYKVSGISKNDFLASYDVMVDVSGVVKILASDNLILSSMGDSFKPAGTLYIDLKEGESVEECISLLRSDFKLADKEIRDVSEYVRRQVNNDSMRIFFAVAVMFAAILSAVLSFSCFYILSIKRSEENEVFYAAGARRRILSLAQYIEAFVYWIIGGSLGLLVSPILVSFFVNKVELEYIMPRVDALCAVKGELCILAVLFLSVAIFDLSHRQLKRKKAVKSRGAVTLMTAGLFVIFLACSVLFCGKIRMLFFVLAVFTMIITAFFAVPILLRSLMSFIEKCIEKRKGTSCFSVLYAVKNIREVKILHNTALLVLLAVSIFVSVTLVVISGLNSIEAIRGIFCGDYAVLNASERSFSEVSDCESVDSAYQVFLGTASGDGGTSVSAISVYDEDVLSDDLKFSKLPSGAEAVISVGVAELLIIGEGDVIDIEISGKNLRLEVIEVTDSATGYILFDSDFHGISKNIVIAKGKDGYSRVNVLDNISEKIALEMAITMPIEDLFEDKIKNVSVFLDSGKILLAVLLIFVAIGVLNNLFESYRARRDDFQLFALAGMKKAEISRVKFYEIFFTFTFGTVLGILLSLLMAVSSHSVMASHGFNMIGNLFFGT